jgi:hypothetical protein
MSCMHATRRKHQKKLICSAISSCRVWSELAQCTHGNPRRPNNNAKVRAKKWDQVRCKRHELSWASCKQRLALTYIVLRMYIRLTGMAESNWVLRGRAARLHARLACMNPIVVMAGLNETVMRTAVLFVNAVSTIETEGNRLVLRSSQSRG